MSIRQLIIMVFRDIEENLPRGTVTAGFRYTFYEMSVIQPLSVNIQHIHTMNTRCVQTRPETNLVLYEYSPRIKHQRRVRQQTRIPTRSSYFLVQRSRKYIVEGMLDTFIECSSLALVKYMPRSMTDFRVWVCAGFVSFTANIRHIEVNVFGFYFNRPPLSSESIKDCILKHCIDKNRLIFTRETEY